MLSLIIVEFIAIAAATMKPIPQLSTALWIGIASGLTIPLLVHAFPLPGELPGAGTDLLKPNQHQTLAQTSTSPPVPPLPTAIPEATFPIADGIVGLYPEPSSPIGVGHLRPQDLSFLEQLDGTDTPYLEAQWLQAVALPLYIEAEGNHWGWLLNGWLIPNGQDPIAIGRDAAFLMLHTYDALFSFPVTEIRDDGWFQLQYTPAGTAWAHSDHLNLGTLELAVEPWENRFLDIGWVEFRDHGLSQSLYLTPADDSTAISMIGPDSFIEPLAFDGDWMQVRVTQPTDGCTVLPGSVTQEGWMQWRNASNQSMVWYPPRGC